MAAHGRSTPRELQQQHTKARLPVHAPPNAMPPPCIYMYRATGLFIYSYHTETEYLVVRTHGPVVTLAYLSVLRQKARALPDGNGTKKKSCHVMHMPINLNLGFIWLSTHPVATSLYLSFPLIAIRPSNYDMGEDLFIQLTFKCHR